MLKEKIFVRQKNFSLYKEPLLKKKRLGWKNDLLKRKSWRKVLLWESTLKEKIICRVK